MSIKYIEPFIDATSRVFFDFSGENPQAQKPYLLRRDEAFEWDISGIIGIGGDSKGVVVISLPAALAFSITSRLVGQKVSEINDDVMDTIGELVNIVAGNAKKGLEQYRLTISLPTIVRGNSHSVGWPSGIPIVGIPFLLSGERFLLAVGLENIIKEGD